MRIRQSYTEEERNFITDMIVNQRMRYSQLTPLFNKKFNKNKSSKDLNTIGAYWGLKPAMPKTKFTKEEKDFIVEMVIDNEMGYEKLAPLFNEKFNKNISADSLRHIGNRLGLKCAHRFKNKLKRNYYDYYGNQAPVGTIVKMLRCRRIGNVYELRIKIKTIPKSVILAEIDKKGTLKKEHLYGMSEYWHAYHRYIYEKHYNVKLKSTDKVIHLDGDMLNNNIDNLLCVNAGVIGYARANNFLDADIDTRRIGLKLGKLNSILKEKQNGN